MGEVCGRRGEREGSVDGREGRRVWKERGGWEEENQRGCPSSSTNTIASVHLVIEVFHERGLRTRIWPVGLDALNTASQS